MVQGILLANDAHRGRRAGSGSRNEPSWETGERGSDVVFATAADSRYQKRGKESERASARATRDALGTFSLYRIAPASSPKEPDSITVEYERT